MRLGTGTIAVVTGAASGIGRALATTLAARGCTVAGVDRDGDALADVALASRHVADVADAAAMRALAADVVARHGGVALLVNNAGVSVAGPFERVPLDDLRWIMGVNFWGVVHGCEAFLPHLRRAPTGWIINVASDFALVGCPTKTGYCASKFAVRGFSEALRAELYGSSIGLTVAYPGATDTAIVRRGRVVDTNAQAAEARLLARGRAPEAVAAAIVRAVERGRGRVLVGSETRLADLASRLAPAWTNALVARVRDRVPFLRLAPR
ncbi:MAG: SDR family oxidoreductase [bacterium]|nr:SDR family oxidoreductase [bacterium]